MESYKLAFKFFVKDTSVITAQELVPVFHKWIQNHAVADHLMIDVADYEHVPEGPGTMLITLEANFALDHADAKPGLLYMRKQAVNNADTFAARLRVIAKTILEAAKRLEEEPSLGGKIQFRTDTFLFRIYDRLLAPSTAQTFADVKPDLEAFVKQVYGSAPSSLNFQPSAESLFEVEVKNASSPAISDLLGRLS